MNRKRLDKIKQEIRRLRRAPQKAAALERLAKRLGRKKVKRGKEPVWESEELQEVFPVSIPKHGTRDLAPGTQRSILDALEEDVLVFEEQLPNDEDEDEDEEDEDGSEEPHSGQS
jgi:hypothetical protein